MSGENFSRATVFWVDDRFEGVPLPDGDCWAQVLGEHTDRVFRLMNMEMEVAASADEALRAAEKYDLAGDTGTFLYCILDLNIPQRPGEEPRQKVGIRLARELRRRGHHLVFLSANTDASSALDKAGLGPIPYFVKDDSGSAWRLPDPLVRALLSECRGRLSWLSLDLVLGLLDPRSELAIPLKTADQVLDPARIAFTHYPFFGRYRDYVERCEFRQQAEANRLLSIRSVAAHSTEFVQQSLLVFFYQLLLDRQGQVVFRYGEASDALFLSRLPAEHLPESIDTVDVIRVVPRNTSPDQLEELLQSPRRIRGTTVFVVPNDESADRIAEVLRRHHVATLEELPHDAMGNADEREVLLHRAAELVLQEWVRAMDQAGHHIRSSGYLDHPELLVNPIDWVILLEAEAVAEDLSDPYEMVQEFGSALFGMEEKQRGAVCQALLEERPVAWEQMLRVGHETFMRSELRDAYKSWVETAINFWLHGSWRFPHGLARAFTAGSDKPEWGQLKHWEDHCYAVLLGMVQEYRDCPGGLPGNPTPGQQDLQRIFRFVDCLGGRDFLDGTSNTVEWDALEFLRWPHVRFPMPLAITRRLREEGRYLWIQPEGLDLATTLPVGRLRYRMLLDVVDHYWSVLVWAREIAEDLPTGWAEPVRYLADTIYDHRVAWAWEQDRARLWRNLWSMLRNAAPLLFICDQTVRGKPLTGSKKAVDAYLSDVHGSGKILWRLRSSRPYRQGSYLAPTWDTRTHHYDVERLRQMASFVNVLLAPRPESDHRLDEVIGSLQDLLRALADAEDAFQADPATDGLNPLARVMAWFFGDEGLAMTSGKSWYDPTPAEHSPFGGLLPSMLGSKADHLWHTLDACTYLAGATLKYRHFDGYDFLSAITDLRNRYKGSTPEVECSVIEHVLDLFLGSLEGLIAQLAFCAALGGQEALADRVRPRAVLVTPPDDFQPPAREELDQVMRVEVTEKGWEIFTLGHPGEGASDQLCYQAGDRLVKIGVGV